jgi:hypothetical protein
MRGTASTYFGLTTFGTSTVAAAVPIGVLVSPVTFTVRVTALVINLGEESGETTPASSGPTTRPTSPPRSARRWSG